MAIIPGEQIVSVSVANESLSSDALAYISGEKRSTEKSVDTESSDNNEVVSS